MLSGLISAVRQIGGALERRRCRSGSDSALAAALIFAAVAWIIVQGAAVAHRRSRLMLHEPLEALWETIGACGEPPRDDSMTFATIGIAADGRRVVRDAAVVAIVFYLSLRAAVSSKPRPARPP